VKHTKDQVLLEFFPFEQYRKPLPNQEKALEFIERNGGNAILELPTGSGKTAVGYTHLRVCEQGSVGPVFYIVPTKTLVEQVQSLHPDVKVAYGRREHSCLHYLEQGKNLPCSSLLPCPHRVDKETGDTKEEGVEPCPYYQAIYELKQGGIGCVSTAFYLYNMLFGKNFELPDGLVIDEVHDLASTVRNCLSFEISDYHLSKSIDLLDAFAPDQAVYLRNFLKTMIRVIKSRRPKTREILEPEELEQLMEAIAPVDKSKVKKAVEEAIKAGVINVDEHAEIVDRLETLVYEVARYYRSFEFSLASAERHALNYTYAYWKEELVGNERKQYVLVIKSYYVAGLIKKILSPKTVAYSATVGDPDIIGYETGFKAPFLSLPSDFPSDNARIYMPKDTPNLSYTKMRRGDKNRTMRKIARACKRFNKKDLRCLVVVISNEEREKFVSLCEEEKVSAITYGNGIPPRQAVTRFKEGEGNVLVGTAANFSEGVDLPKGLAPIIFFLRPGWPSPRDPNTKFEEQRFGQMVWRIWSWRVMMESLQVRGRNIRSIKDVGVTFFISQGFRSFLYGALSAELKTSYRGEFSYDECVDDAMKLLE
jgi:Rad3-related DNA helicase